MQDGPKPLNLGIEMRAVKGGSWIRWNTASCLAKEALDIRGLWYGRVVPDD